MSRIPKERLNLIAKRKLDSLGILTGYEGAGEDLVGELVVPGRTASGASGPMVRMPFVVVEHDKMRFRTPPLDAIGPVVFYDCDTAAALEAKLRAEVDKRLQIAVAAERKLRAAGVEASVDRERFVAYGHLQAAHARFDLVADGAVVRVARVASPRGSFDVPREHGAVRLEDFGSRVDLEVHLASRVDDWHAASVAVARAAEEAARSRTTPQPLAMAPELLDGLKPVPASTEVPGLGAMVARLGAMAVPIRLEVMQDFVLGGERYRFVATHEAGTRFRGKLLDQADISGRPIWDDVFDLTLVQSLGEIVGFVLGMRGASVAASAGDTTSVPVADVPEHLQPHAGEVWVMNVAVESDADGEVRYVVMDVDGRPYGAQRVLRRADFDAVFTSYGSGFRMAVLVDEVRAGEVVYRQLDGAGSATGAQRRIPLSHMVATFVPEASLY